MRRMYARVPSGEKASYFRPRAPTDEYRTTTWCIIAAVGFARASLRLASYVRSTHWLRRTIGECINDERVDHAMCGARAL